MNDAPADVALPSIPGRRWHLAVDTARSSPLDIVERGRQVKLAGESRTVGGRSVVVLEARARPE